MKKTIKLAVVAALALGATSAFATNGDVMIGQGAKSRSMGGVGIAKSFGAESGLANPAMIAAVEKSEATLVVTAFAPNVSFRSNAGANANKALPAGTSVTNNYETSDSSFSVIPELAYATRVTDNTVIGLSVSGTAGMGTDYDDTKFNTAADNGSFRMKTALSLLKVAVPVSYQIGGFTAGIAGVMQYGSLQMSHMAQNSTGAYFLRDNGASTDIGYGLEVGASYVVTKSLTLGAVYKSKIGMTYDNVIGASIKDFQVQNQITSGDNLDQPEERGVGISYSMGDSTIAADYKNIAWGDAAGYKDFGWENQDVYAVGYEYDAKSWAFRMGYNYAKNPIAEQNGAKGMTAQGPQGYTGAVKNFFNLSGFPGIVETHYTIGGAYSISDSLSLDGAFIYVPETSLSYDTSGMTEAFSYAANGGKQVADPANAAASSAATATASSSADVKHSQMGLTLAMSYKF